MNAATAPSLLAADTLAECLAVADPAGGALPAAACAAAREAQLLAAALQRPLEQARAGAWLCTQLLRMGRHAELLHEAPAALALLVPPALLDERRELLRVMALSGSETGAFDVALDAAHALVDSTAASADDGPKLNAAFALAACFERMGDSWQAVRVLGRALQNHGGSAPDLPLLVATNGLCAMGIGIVHRLRGTGEDAEARQMLQRARAAGEQALQLLGPVPDPMYAVAVLGNLGEVMLHQGDVAQAEPLLQQALAGALQRGLQAHAWRVQATLGDWLLAAGRPADALAAMQRLLHEMGDTALPQTAIRARHAAYGACRALQQFEQALGHFEVLERMERRRTISQLRAQSQLFVTRTEAQHAQWQAEERAERAQRDAQQQRARAAEFAARAEHDPLTGLGNRRQLERCWLELLPPGERRTQPLALAQIDIDHFKAINDAHGHAAGDRVLVTMAMLLRENTRTGDVLARHGGEEFVVVLPGMALDRAAEVCERLRERVQGFDWETLGAPGLAVTVSIGLAAAPPDDAAVLMQRADEALYRAKRGGRNRLCVSAAEAA